MQELQIYLAGTFTFGIGKDQLQYRKCLPEEAAIADSIPNVLESYHYVGAQRKVNELRNAGAKVFLDSGAFSAKSLGIEITIEDYVQYIKENEDLIRVENGVLMAASLDAIGDDYKTYCNQLETERLGVKTIPTFHQGEDTRYLDWYVANYDYISLGGIVGGNPRQLEIWLDRMWSKHLLDGAGNPKVMVHGFGMTSVPLMERYPWYSCDSSSWIQTSAFGAISIPGYGNINVSAESPSRHVAGEHMDNITELERSRLLEIIRQQGFNTDNVRQRYLGRVTYNMWAFTELESMINEKKRAGGPRVAMARELF